MVIWKLMLSQWNGFKQGAINGDLGSVPAHFLVGKNGNVETAFYGRHFADHIDLHTVARFIRREW